CCRRPLRPIVAAMPNYRRAFVPGGCWFFTVNLLDRRRRLLTDHVDALREATRLTQTRHPFTINAMVVLADHIHAVWTLPHGNADFSLRWRLIKIVFVKAVPKTELRSTVRIARGERVRLAHRHRDFASTSVRRISTVFRELCYGSKTRTHLTRSFVTKGAPSAHGSVALCCNQEATTISDAAH